MANQKKHTNEELAKILEDIADSNDDVRKHEEEEAIRDAAERLRNLEDPIPLLPRLVRNLDWLATHTPDSSTRDALRNLLGEPSTLRVVLGKPS